MAPIPLRDGDLHWVFPHLVEVAPVLDLLSTAADLVERLAAHLGGHDDGLAFDHLPGAPYAGLTGGAHTEELIFEVRLSLPRHPRDLVVSPPPPWLVDGEVSVRCDAIRDCGRHEIETLESAHGTPVEAAEGVLAVSAWLLARGTTVPPTAWRERDVLSRHR
ncbi:hypothetical protein [Saccharothrix syringae]|uniref:Uncharacterized protein n=1 Tax=Saccharothrix syringae TaxID=103733 RepID=A0A5Q0H6H8_SACSY|nr:hypothetical protein [Saccharothrix syringae]QFZ21759.1 hypothetical protein EKG83_34070 [Saccharothrix syringae]